jgi:hypothetical protein
MHFSCQGLFICHLMAYFFCFKWLRFHAVPGVISSLLRRCLRPDENLFTSRAAQWFWAAPSDVPECETNCTMTFGVPAGSRLTAENSRLRTFLHLACRMH